MVDSLDVVVVALDADAFVSSLAESEEVMVHVVDVVVSDSVAVVVGPVCVAGEVSSCTGVGILSDAVEHSRLKEKGR